MTDQFDPTWPHGHVTRDGEWDAEILRSDIAGDAPIVAVLTCRKTKKQIVHMYLADGKKDQYYYLSCTDLLNAPAPKRKVWANIYAAFSYDSKEVAEAASKVWSGSPRFACVEVEEGQGLSREDDRS